MEQAACCPTMFGSSSILRLTVSTQLYNERAHITRPVTTQSQTTGPAAEVLPVQSPNRAEESPGSQRSPPGHREDLVWVTTV